MPDEISEGLKQFFETVWRDTQGYVYLPTINHGQQLTKYMYEWPRQKSAVVKHVINQDSLGNDVFYAPSLFKEAKPEKDSVLGAHVFWTDFDGNAPQSWPEIAKKHSIPEPSLIIASSVEGREHAYWSLAGFESSVEQIDSRNRALAYTLGADTGGWDANQFLRPPFTHNYGYNNKGEHKPWYEGVPLNVRLIRASNERVNPNVFNPLGSPEYIVSQQIDLGPIPGITDVFMLGRWPEDFRTLFNLGKDEAATASKEGRSGSLTRLGYYGAENGFSDEQIYAILLDADNRWEKYKGRHDQERRLVEIIARARAKHGYIGEEGLTFAGLVTDATAVVTDSKLIYSFQEFSDLEIKIDWMMEGLLRNEGMGVIVGPPGVGKTQLGIQMCAHIALGWDFLGWKNLTTPKKVVFFSLEMGKVPLQVFMNKIKGAYTNQIHDLSKNFHVMPLGEGIPLESKQGQKFVEGVLAEYQPDFVVVDSLQKVTSKELSDEISIKMMLEFLDKMRQKYHTAMTFVHHNRKKPSDSSGGIIDLDDMYGSRYIGANIEFALDMRELAKNVNTVTHVKNRLGEKRSRFEITRTEFLQYVLGTEIVTMEGLLKNGAANRPPIPQRPSDTGGSGGLLNFT